MGYIFMYGIGLKNWNKCIFTEWNWIGITLLVYDWIKLVVYTMEWEFIYKYWYIQMEQIRQKQIEFMNELLLERNV